MNQAIIIGSIGLWRKFLKDTLEEEGINTICFVDTVESGMSYSGVPIITPEELPRYTKGFNGLVLVTFPIKDKRREDFFKRVLEYIGDHVHVLSFTEVYKKYKNALIMAKKVGDLWLSEDYDKDSALDVIELLSDEKSKHIVSSWIKFRETLDIDYIVDPEEPQYFPNDLSVQNFVPQEYALLDLGAFTGDSYLFLKDKLSEYSKKLTLYAGIEADQENFLKLVKTVEENETGEKVILLNTACFSKNTYIEFFKTGTDRSSYLNFSDIEVKNEKVKLIAAKLDVILRNFKFDIVKADIEGAEFECLCGMENIITNSNSVMMISIYHKPEDIYQITKFVKEKLNNHELFVRVHSSFFINTILYAIPRN
uniref:FkbM family methyltransferase n=1 Tax=Fervidobacterium pennivorans TaxID=93466 RepID=A0A7V4CPL3_FERPE